MDNLTLVSGGVCAPKGFTAAGLHCGIRKSQQKKDIAIIKSDVPCTAAAMYTKNKVFGAPITVTRAHLTNGVAQAVVVNSGNANTCNFDGVEKAEQMCALTASAINISPEDVIVGSTGVIGQPIDMAPIERGIKELGKILSPTGNGDAAEAIMTTDTIKKECAVSFPLSGKTAAIGAMAKGSGMIHINMATMLCFVTTDASISAPLLDAALRESVADTLNMVSVDGDTSTNDMVSILANGLANNPVISEKNADYAAFCTALTAVLTEIAKLLVTDGEGASKRILCSVSGAPDTETARLVAKSVICSNLVKTAVFGADANWGRILCAIGYTDADFAIDTVDVDISSKAGSVTVCAGGVGVPFDEALAKRVLEDDDIHISVDLHQGKGFAKAWGCDLTYDYVKINGSYRT